MNHNSYFVRGLFVFILVGPNALASISDRSEIATPEEGPQYTVGTLNQPSGIYRLRKGGSLIPNRMETLGQPADNSGRSVLHLKRGERIFTKPDPESGLIALTVVVDSNQIGLQPNTFFVTQSDLRALELEMLAEGDDEADLYADSEMDAYEVAGKCVANTRRRLRIPDLPGICATDVSDGALRRVGFVRTHCGRAQLALWAGGHPVRGHRGKCGHMAYKSGSRWSSGDTVGDPGSKYHSQRCYARAGTRNRVG